MPVLAKRLRWYLVSVGIETRVDDLDEQDVDIWVLNDRDLPRSKQLMAEFIASPEASKYCEAEKAGRAKYRRERQKSAEQARREVDARTQIFGRSPASSTYATFAVLTLCVVYFILQFVDKERWLFRHLMLTQDVLARTFGRLSLREVASGELWRLVTPIFLHNDIFHIGFNMLWFVQFARAIETRVGPWKLIALIIGIAIPSNLAFFVVSGPVFGGMSGVIYGLLAYMWVANRYALRAEFVFDQTLVNFFVIFYVLCWLLSAVGFRVANTVHGVGALAGGTIAFIVSGYWRRVSIARLVRGSSPLSFLIAIFLLAGAVITDWLTR